MVDRSRPSVLIVNTRKKLTRATVEEVLKVCRKLARQNPRLRFDRMPVGIPVSHPATKNPPKCRGYEIDVTDRVTKEYLGRVSALMESYI